jgi:hypothetical protein
MYKSSLFDCYVILNRGLSKLNHLCFPCTFNAFPHSSELLHFRYVHLVDLRTLLTKCELCDKRSNHWRVLMCFCDSKNTKICKCSLHRQTSSTQNGDDSATNEHLPDIHGASRNLDYRMPGVRYRMQSSRYRLLSP